MKLNPFNVSNTRMLIICLRNVWKYEFERNQLCYLLSCSSLINPGKNSVRDHKNFILYALIGFHTREVTFKEMFKQQILTHCLKIFISKICSINNQLYDFFGKHSRDILIYFQNLQEIIELLIPKNPEIPQILNQMAVQFMAFFDKWKSSLSSSVFKNSNEMDATLQNIRLHLEKVLQMSQTRDMVLKPLKFNKRVYSKNYRSRIKDAKKDMLKSGLLLNKIVFIDLKESFQFVKNLFTKENKKSDEVQLDSVRLDLTCKMTFTPLEMPCRGNNCFHLSCFSLKNYFLLVVKQENTKVYCPICREPIQVNCLF